MAEASTEPTVESLQAALAELQGKYDALVASPPEAKPDPKAARALKDALKAAENLQRDLEAVTAERDELNGKVAEVTTKGTLREHGITDADDADYVLHRYGKLTVEEGEEKPALSEFLADAKRAKAAWYAKIATPAKPNKAAAPIEDTAPAKAEPKVDPPAAVATPAAPAVAAPAATPAAPAKSPDAAAASTVVSTKPAGGQLTAAQIAALSPEQYKAHRKRIHSEVGLTPAA